MSPLNKYAAALLATFYTAGAAGAAIDAAPAAYVAVVRTAAIADTVSLAQQGILAGAGAVGAVADTSVSEVSCPIGQAAEGVTTLSSSAIQFSQSSVNAVAEIAQSMAANGWSGGPIDVVQVGDELVTVDNTRLLAASMTDTPVQAVIHGAGEALPELMAGRFGNATTWGEAVMNRIAGQNAAYQSFFPNGSWAVGVGAP